VVAIGEQRGGASRENTFSRFSIIVATHITIKATKSRLAFCSHIRRCRDIACVTHSCACVSADIELRCTHRPRILQLFHPFLRVPSSWPVVAFAYSRFCAFLISSLFFVAEKVRRFFLGKMNEWKYCGKPLVNQIINNVCLRRSL